MKKVVKIEDFSKEVSKTDKILSKIAIISLVVGLGLGSAGVVNELSKDKSNKYITSEVSAVEKSDNSLSSVENSTNNINIFVPINEYSNSRVFPKNSATSDESDDGIYEYEEVRVEAVINKVYELPTGFKMASKEDGTYYGYRTMPKIEGHEDYPNQYYSMEDGYTVIDCGSYFEIRTTPKELITYSVPEGFTLVEDGVGGYYGIKRVAKPITKKLS